VVRSNAVFVPNPADGLVPFPKRLFWAGRAFALQRRIEAGGGTPVCKLELTPQEPALTELRVSGESLCYAVLRDTNGYTVVLQEPSGTVKVPQGFYAVSAAWLRKGAAEAYRVGHPSMVVNAMSTTNLVLGGPLTHWVKLGRTGRKLIMLHRLTGADGGFYRLAKEDQEKPPAFTVYHGGKKALADKFQYG